MSIPRTSARVSGWAPNSKVLGMPWFGVSPWECGPASADDNRHDIGEGGPDDVSAEGLEAHKRHAARVFWRAQEQDVIMLNLLRGQAGLPPIVPDTSAQPLALGSGGPKLRLP
jgi:hypothetical protein